MVWLLGVVVWISTSIATALTVGRVMGRVDRRDVAVERAVRYEPEPRQSATVAG